MPSNLKRMVRDVQERTGWKYAFALHLVRELRYEVVDDAIDNAIEKEGEKVDFITLGKKLNALVKTKLNEELGLVTKKDIDAASAIVASSDKIVGKHIVAATPEIVRANRRIILSNNPPEEVKQYGEEEDRGVRPEDR